MTSNSINSSGGNIFPRFSGKSTQAKSAQKAIEQLPYVCFSPTADRKAQAVTDTFYQTGDGKPAIDFFKQQEKALTGSKKRKSDAITTTPNKSARTQARRKPARKEG